MSGSQPTGADAEDGPGRVYVGLIHRGADGRFREVEIIPDPDASGDQVLVWDDARGEPVWRSPSELGFSPNPLILDLPLVDAEGFEVTDADGVSIFVNVASDPAA